MSTAEKTADLLKQYRTNLGAFAKGCLTIRTKAGEVVRFPGFNSAQRYIHSRLETQKKETGRVRAIILKGRQQGSSTYIGARFYRKASLFSGVGVYILTHEQAATDNLFKMVERFQINNPLAPHTGTENAKELEFDRLDSSYVVATAGQKAGGRGRTITLFHGSEVAFWQSAPDHFASSVQTVPDMPGTEIILESTGNGASGEFYERWQDAQNGVGDYIPIFVPWFWQEEYRRTPPRDFQLSDEPGDNGVSEKEYARLYKIDDDQMAWRRAKVAELRSVQLFDQEYPASPAMAFQSADLKKSLILPIQVLRARKRDSTSGLAPIVPVGPLIIGADPSGPGKDRFAVAARQGLKVLWIEHRQMPDETEAAYWLKGIIDEHSPDRMFIDLGNMGHAIFSMLRTYGDHYRKVVRGVNFGSPSQAKRAFPLRPGPKNRRAEMWDRSRQWLDLEETVSLPDMDVLQADATGPRKKPLLNGDFLLESKEQMKERGLRSPDLWDSVALTFAEEEIIVESQTRKSAEKRALDKSPKSVYQQDPVVAEHELFPATSGGADSWMG